MSGSPHVEAGRPDVRRASGHGRSGLLTACAVAVALAVTVAVEFGSGTEAATAIGDGIAGGALLVAGIVALGGGRGRGSGALLVAAGAAWLAGTLLGDLVFLHRGALLHLVLAYPRLRPDSRAAGALIATGYLAACLAPVARNAGVTLAFAVVLIGGAALRRRGAAGVQGRARTAALAAGLLLGTALAVSAAGRLASGSIDDFALWCYNVAVTLTAVGVAVDLRWGRWARAAVNELVVDLGELERPGALRDRLARTLGDPELELGFRASPDGGYVDEAGRAVRVPETTGDRRASYAEDAGVSIAVLVHDASLLEDRRLLDAALSAVRLAAANERMQREVRAGIEELEASRRRLVEAAIEQRRTLEQELRTGAEHRLGTVTERLSRIEGAGEPVVTLLGSVARAREDLRRFAQGIHPAVLTDHGLGAALQDAATAMPFEVTVEAPPERLPSSVEVTIYFLCTEALANAGKHAQATRVDIAVRRRDGHVEVSVRDDGAGGAALDRGTGLRGLADRVQALGGTLGVDSPAGRGTHLTASVPI